MTSETGIMAEALKYSQNHKLPIHFVDGDNICQYYGYKKVWAKITFQKKKYDSYYRYNLKYPHAGAGVRVEF